MVRTHDELMADLVAASEALSAAAKKSDDPNYRQLGEDSAKAVEQYKRAKQRRAAK